MSSGPEMAGDHTSQHAMYCEGFICVECFRLVVLQRFWIP